MITVNARDLLSGIQKVEHGVPKDLGRPVLAQIRVEVNGEGLRLVAADNYRIPMVTVPAVVESPEVEDFPIWNDQIRMLKTWLKEEGGYPVEIRIGDGMIALSGPKGMLGLPLRDHGIYPDYERVIPEREGMVSVALNARFLLDLGRGLLQEKGKEPIVLVWVRPHPEGKVSQEPILIETQDGSFREVVMPVRVRDWPKEKAEEEWRSGHMETVEVKTT